MKTYMHYEIYLHGGIQELTMYMKIYMYYVIYEHAEKCIYYVIDIHEICRCSVIYVSGDICVLCDIFKYIYMNI